MFPRRIDGSNASLEEEQNRSNWPRETDPTRRCSESAQKVHEVIVGFEKTMIRRKVLGQGFQEQRSEFEMKMMC
jgi:hypothetical protein